MPIRRTLRELHLRYQLRPQSHALLPFVRREAPAPPAGARLGEVRERTFGDLQGRCLAISRSRLAGVNPTRVRATYTNRLPSYLPRFVSSSKMNRERRR